MNRSKLLLFCLFTLLPFYLFMLLKPVRAARLYFDPGQKSAEKNSSFNADLWLDTEGKKTTGTDVVLEFDSGKVSVDTVSFTDIYPSSAVRKKDNSNGRLEISTYFTDFISFYQGKDRLATIRFKAKDNNVDVKFICQGGQTVDTNVLEMGGGDIVNCGSSGGLAITITSSSPSPSPGSSPTPTPSPTPGPPASNGCDKESPDRPAGLTATSGPGRGQVTLRWNKVSKATHYAIVYGQRWLDFDYGAPNVGDTNQFIVNGLKTNVPYYFAITAVNDCASSGYSDGAAAYAGWGAVSTARQITTPQDKGWQPPEKLPFLDDEDEATQGAEFEASPSAKQSPKPYYEPPKPQSPWEKPDFWKKLGWIILVLFLLWLFLGFWRRRKKKKRLMKMGKEIEDVTGRFITGKKSTPSVPSPPPPPF